jgi:S-DNA-T family DNA segregation ATPase FtsK/SpoIIIE
VAAAWSATGRALPPAPWPPPLPDEIELAAVLEEEDAARPPGEGLSRVVVGVVDRPAEQRQVPLCWLPGEGNLLVIGAAGSGTTTTLLAVAASAWSSRVGGLDVVGLERRAGSLRELVDVPSATVVGPAGPGRAEVIQRLAASLEQRSSTGEVGTPVLVLVDGWPVLPDDPDGWTVREALVRLWVDGPAEGIHLAVASERSAAVPAAVAAGTTQRWYMRPCDPSELVLAGMGSQGAAQTFVPGRLLVAGGGWEAQVGLPARVLQGITRGCGRNNLKLMESY